MALTIESKQQSLLGTDQYRNKAVAVPRAYQPTVVLTASANAAGTNVNMTVRSDDYVVANVDGRQLQTDRFICTTKFGALQAVTAEVERARIFDTHVAFLIAARESIIAGKLPDNALTVTI